MRGLTAIVLVAVFGSAAAAQTDARTSCATAAVTDYNKANLALMDQKDGLLMSPESLIAQRRLEEQYCLRLTRCLLGDAPSNVLAYRTEFSSCLQDESLEKYDAVPREDGDKN
jgi:hypothetical protein